MREKWTGVAVGQMHIWKITQTELGEKMGVGKTHVSQILNCKRKPKGIRRRVMTALGEIITERKEGQHERSDGV